MHVKTREKWIGICNQFLESDLTIAQFCYENSLSVHTFKEIIFKFLPAYGHHFCSSDERKKRVFENRKTYVMPIREKEVIFTKNQEYWIDVCKKFHESSLTMPEFCAANEITMESLKFNYYYVLPSIGVVLNLKEHSQRVRARKQKTKPQLVVEWDWVNVIVVDEGGDGNDSKH